MSKKTKPSAEETRRAINGRLALDCAERLVNKLHREVNRRNDLTSEQLGTIADQLMEMFANINTLKTDR